MLFFVLLYFHGFIEFFREAYLLMQCSRYGWKNFWVSFCGQRFSLLPKVLETSAGLWIILSTWTRQPIRFAFVFAIKVCMKNTGVTVDHLQMKISRAMKFLLNRGATAFIKLYSTSYCLSTCTSGIRNSLSCGNPNATNLKEQRNNWFVQKRDRSFLL